MSKVNSKEISDLEAEVVARVSAVADQKTNDPESVRAFLAEHEHVLAPRVLREVNNKLVSGLKNVRLGR